MKNDEVDDKVDVENRRGLRACVPAFLLQDSCSSRLGICKTKRYMLGSENDKGKDVFC